MRYPIFLILLLIGFYSSAQHCTVESVPNPKSNNGFVSNPDNILSEGTVNEINSLLTSLEEQTSSQVAVVVLDSICDNDIFDFAQNLFKHWGIGQAKEDNGLLILLALDKRTVRLHTGYGLEGDLPDIITKHIEMRKMVPYFKEGDYDTGILEGVREVVRILSKIEYRDSLKTELSDSSESSDDNSHSEAEASQNLYQFLVIAIIVWIILMVIAFIFNWTKGNVVGSPKFKQTDAPNIKTGVLHFLIWFVAIPIGTMLAGIYANSVWVFIGSFYGYWILGAAETRVRTNTVYDKYLEKKEFYTLHQFLTDKLSFWKMTAILLPIPFAFLYRGYKNRLTFLREHTRDCAQCGKPCTKLSEKTEDPFLDQKQQFEETLKSVDYDVWKCSFCEATQVFRYPTAGTQYEECPKCETVAYYISSTRTIRSATTSSEGLKEETKTCKYCKFKNVRTFTIPRKSDSSSSSGSSSSGGGSFGDGSSGGGGSSSSW